MMSASLNHCKMMGAEPGRRFLKQPAAKLEPVIVVIAHCEEFIQTLYQVNFWKYFHVAFKIKT